MDQTRLGGGILTRSAFLGCHNVRTINSMKVSGLVTEVGGAGVLALTSASPLHLRDHMEMSLVDFYSTCRFSAPSLEKGHMF